MQNNFTQGAEARNKLAGAIQKCSEIVGGTMGTSGYNGLIAVMEHPFHLLTNDGITLLQNLHFKDPVEQMGKNVLLEAVSRSNKAGGDGSSTTTVCTNAIIQEGLKHLDKHSPMEIKKSLEDCLPLIEESINKQKREIVKDGKIDLTLLEQVATISAEDPTIGKTIADIYKEIGVGGIIHWDISKTMEDTYTIGKGITIDGCAFASAYFADMDEKTGQFTNSLRWKDPKILITKQKITTAGEFENLFKTLDAQGHKEVAIFCDEFEPTVIAQLVQTRLVRGFKAALIRMPTLFKDHWYVDLPKVTGAQVIDGIAIKLKDANVSHLGTVAYITADKENTYLDGIQDVSEHIKTLNEEDTEDSKLRASKLNTKTARYFVGAQSDSALAYRRLKVEDALNSSYYAIKDGIVAGGGVALLNAANSVTKEGVGGVILEKALQAPIRQIIKNSGFEFEYKSDQKSTKEFVWLSGKNPTHGYDTKEGKIIDMFEAGIVDSASITLNAIRNAISVAASILTCNVIITVPQQSVTDAIVQELLAKRPQ